MAERKIIEITDEILTTNEQLRELDDHSVKSDFQFISKLDELLSDFSAHDQRQDLEEELPEKIRRMRNSDRNRMIRQSVDRMKHIIVQVDSELAVAREIQQRLLPDQAYVTDRYEILGFNEPSYFVGGDYFDYFPVGSDKFFFGIGGVSGKGVSASLLMAFLKAYLGAKLEAEIVLTEVLERTNNFIYNNSPLEKYITFFGGMIDLEHRHIEYINAGHNPPLHFKHDGEPASLQVGGTILGAFPDVTYESGIISLETMELLVMFTDGVTETENHAEDMFSEERLLASLFNCRKPPTGDIIKSVIADLNRFSQKTQADDDVTLLILRSLVNSSLPQ